MTKFNPYDKPEKELTYGDILGPAMKITDKADAKQYLEAYITHIQKHLDIEPNKVCQTAEAIAKANLGYYAGYYDDQTRVRVEKLFECSHPVFGSIAQKGAPTPEEAFNAGLKVGKQAKGR